MKVDIVIITKFVPNLAEMFKPLKDLLRKDVSWMWGKDEQDAFRSLKMDLASLEILALYSPERETVFFADSISYGLVRQSTTHRSGATLRTDWKGILCDYMESWSLVGPAYRYVFQSRHRPQAVDAPLLVQADRRTAYQDSTLQNAAD